VNIFATAPNKNKREENTSKLEKNLKPTSWGKIFIREKVLDSYCLQKRCIAMHCVSFETALEDRPPSLGPILFVLLGKGVVFIFFPIPPPLVLSQRHYHYL
jgi:hypothetical protein